MDGQHANNADDSNETHATTLSERLAALETQLARQEECLAQQHAEIEGLRGALAAVHAEADPLGATSAAQSALPSRRMLLKFGGAAAVAGVAAGAAVLARPGVAHASTGWATGSVNADTETLVKPLNSSYASNDVLQLQYGTGIPYQQLGGPNLSFKAALAAYDTTTNNVGVYATSSNGFGVFGVTNTGAGTVGAGLNGTANSTGTGVLGVSSGGIGVQGNGAAYGGSFSGGLAPLLLSIGFGQGAPTLGTHTKGELYLDTSATLWICAGSGTPGQWSKVGAAQPGLAGGGVNLLPAPIRIFDSRPGQPAPLPLTKGPLAGGSTTPIQVTGVSVNGLSVPDRASAVIGNLTVTQAQNFGDLILYPSGAAQPLTSNINYGPGQTIANFAIVGLGPINGIMNVYVHVSGTHVIFDVVGFIN